MNFRLKLWNIKEICNTLTASSIVSIVLCGKIWSKVFREASVSGVYILVKQARNTASHHILAQWHKLEDKIFNNSCSYCPRQCIFV